MGRADLVITWMAVPSIALPGSNALVSDTVKNQGLISAEASSVRFFLSRDDARSAEDKLLVGSHAVPILAAGAEHEGAATLTIPAGTPVGPYFILACADYASAVVEAEEANNCRAAEINVGVTLATAPFPWNVVTSGVVQCRILNVSATSPTVAVTMHVGPTILHTDTAQISPNGGTFASAVVQLTSNPTTNPSHCTCQVPDPTKFFCSFSYISPSGAITVIRGR